MVDPCRSLDLEERRAIVAWLDDLAKRLADEVELYKVSLVLATARDFIAAGKHHRAARAAQTLQ